MSLTDLSTKELQAAVEWFELADEYDCRQHRMETDSKREPVSGLMTKSYRDMLSQSDGIVNRFIGMTTKTELYRRWKSWRDDPLTRMLIEHELEQR